MKHNPFTNLIIDLFIKGYSYRLQRDVVEENSFLNESDKISQE